MFSNDSSKVNQMSKKISICKAIETVKQKNVTLTINKENCVCPGGRHFIGLEILPIETLVPAVTSKRHRVYESTDIALASLRKQPQPAKRGDYLTLGPLEKFEDNPDLVLFVATPAEADRILGLLSFKGAEPFMYYPASSICSTLTNTLAKGRPEINLISKFERTEGTWSSGELILAMPLKDFKAAIENIPNSGYVEKIPS